MVKKNTAKIVIVAAAAAALIAGCGKKAENKAAVTTAAGTEAISTEETVSETTLSQMDNENPVLTEENPDGSITINSGTIGSNGVTVGEDIPEGSYLVTTVGAGVFSIRKEGQAVTEMQATRVGTNKDIGQTELTNEPFQLDKGDKLFMSSHDDKGLTLTLVPDGIMQGTAETAAPSESPEETAVPSEKDSESAETTDETEALTEAAPETNTTKAQA